MSQYFLNSVEKAIEAARPRPRTSDRVHHRRPGRRRASVAFSGWTARPGQRRVEPGQGRTRCTSRPRPATWPAVQPGAPMFGIESGFGEPGRLRRGAVPLTDAHGAVIGAVGVGGGFPTRTTRSPKRSRPRCSHEPTVRAAAGEGPPPCRPALLPAGARAVAAEIAVGLPDEVPPASESSCRDVIGFRHV